MTAASAKAMSLFSLAVLANLASALSMAAAFVALGAAGYGDRAASWIHLGALLVLSYVLVGFGTWCASTAGMLVSIRLRESTLEHVLNIDPDAAHRLGSGRAQSIVLDAELVGALLVSSGPGSVLGIGQATVGLVALLASDRAIAALTTVAALIVMMAVGTGMLARTRRVWSKRRADLTDAIIQRTLGLRTVSVQEDPAEAEARGASLHASYVDVSRRMDNWSLFLAACASCGAAVLLVAVCAGVQAGHSVAANLGASLLLGMGVTKIATGLTDGVMAWDAFRRLKVLQAARHTSPSIDNDGRSALMTARGVTHLFPTGEGVRRPISIDLDDGQALLITGASGAGKSTLAELLSGRREAHSGSIRLRRGIQVTRVPQAGDDYMFHASLLFNVMCGSEWPPTEEGARRAAGLLTELGLDAAVEQMPNGIAQPVGEGGWRLSSGEVARVSLARALHSAPDVLIMDETTAPLDPVSRERVLAAARRHSRALIVIAHP